MPPRGNRAAGLLRAMGMLQDKQEWLEKHQKATLEEAFEAGYLACTTNWCQHKR